MPVKKTIMIAATLIAASVFTSGVANADEQSYLAEVEARGIHYPPEVLLDFADIICHPGPASNFRSWGVPMDQIDQQKIAMVAVDNMCPENRIR